MVRRTLSKPSLRVEALEERAVPTGSVFTVDQGSNIISNPDYTSIKAALEDNLPTGSVLRVYDGTYTDALEIETNGLKILNKGGAVIKPSSLAEDDAAVDIRATDVFFKGFVIDLDDVTSPTGSSSFDSAIRVTSNGSATIRSNTIKNVFDADGTFDSDNNPTGFAIAVGDRTSATIGEEDGGGAAKILYNTIEDFGKSGILVQAGTVSDGTTQSSRAIVKHNTITGVSGATVEQLGIDIFGTDGAVTVRASRNTVTNVVDNANFFPTAIAVTDTDSDDWVHVSRNTLTGDGFGVYVFGVGTSTAAANVKIYHNSITQNDFTGLTVEDSYGVKVVGNVVSDNGQDQLTAFGTGIKLIDAWDTEVVGNVANDNDESGIYVLRGGDNYIAFDVTNYNGYDGVTLDNTTGNLVLANLVINNGNNGISLINGATSNTVKLNFILQSSGFTIVTDANSTGNTIEDNVEIGESSVTAGLEGTSSEDTAAASATIADADDLEDDYTDA